ncbi:protein MpCYP704K1 [Marchantia polymorpha subsp. ruderalis]|uniref:Cytochrome P450 n=2 Tax=Marchantia polymorpha TaxID=3197 RepID=A0AAF6BP97_MARPO|nr:hypothetical protein MARPO_0173s0023 [Marchantia polymorpha]BBN13831.1 hypothetical protein Mp_6g06780 [Marchantia polymorpha subsp. ruderalis]|eukprot:PTQ28120.1 hypothetical protein MARPO_0173s0023 [Marchantia polymorpha]
MGETMLNETASSGGGGFAIRSLDWASAFLQKEVGIALTATLLVGLYTLVAFWLKNRRPGQLTTWPLIGSLPTLTPQWPRLYEFITEQLEKNDVLWAGFAFGFEGVYIADPPSVEYILKTNFPNFPKGVGVQERMRELLGHGIFAADGLQWKNTRKVASLEFSSSILRDHSADVFKELSLTLTRIVSQYTDSKTPINMQDLFMRMTLDGTCKVGFGVELGCLSPSLPEVPFHSNFDLANELSFHRYIDPFWKVKKFFNKGDEKVLKKCVDAMDEFVYDVINRRRAELQAAQNDGPQRPDLLTRFMTMTDKADEALSDKAIRDHVVNFIIAGRDTTAITLSWFIYRICLHPQVAEKIFQEVTALEEDENALDGDEEQSDDPIERFARVLSFYNVAKLKYLHCALTETLRLYPAVPLDGKIAEADDVLPNGAKVKKGTLVTYASYSMGRLEKVWGPDARMFKPERWLKDGSFHPESPFKFVSFHGGLRQCLGKESAYLQMKITAALLVRFFKFELVPNQDVRPRVMFVLAMAEGVKVIATRR